MKKYQNCTPFICVIPGGIFNKDEVYPVYNIDGYSCVVVLNVVKHKLESFDLDSYTDGYYKVVGTFDECENAVFRRCIINANS